MNGLKLLSYIILLITVLVSRPGTDLCFYHGSLEIVNNSLSDKHNHCAENSHSKNENSLKNQQDHQCCVAFTIAENQGNVIQNNNFLGFKLICLPVVAQNYFIELQKQFAPNSRDFQANNTLNCRAIDLERIFQKTTSFQFTSSVLLLI